MTRLSFSLNAAQDCAFAQSAAIALRCRGQRFDWSPADARYSALIIQMPDGHQVRANTIPVLLDWLEELHPAQSLYAADAEVRSHERSLLPRVERMYPLLETAAAARNDRDLDLALHFLHDALSPFAHALRNTHAPLGNVDVALAPILWRADVMDQTFGSRILAGQPILAQRIAVLMAATPVGSVLSDRVARSFTSKCHEAKGILGSGRQSTDWTRAFGAVTRSRHMPAGKRFDLVATQVGGH